MYPYCKELNLSKNGKFNLLQAAPFLLLNFEKLIESW